MIPPPLVLSMTGAMLIQQRVKFRTGPVNKGAGGASLHNDLGGYVSRCSIWAGPPAVKGIRNTNRMRREAVPGHEAHYSGTLGLLQLPHLYMQHRQCTAHVPVPILYLSLYLQSGRAGTRRGFDMEFGPVTKAERIPNPPHSPLRHFSHGQKLCSAQSSSQESTVNADAALPT